MSQIVYPNGTQTFTVAANESIAVYTKGTATVFRNVGYPNFPNTSDSIGTVTDTETVFGPYSTGAEIVVNAGANEVYVATGTAPRAKESQSFQVQGAPVALNATGALTSAAILSGIVTSTSAAATDGTLPTGAVLDAATELEIGDSFDWSVINTGPNTFTVLAAASGHTVVGTMAVVTVTSGRFRTRKTAAETFVTYRI